MSRMQKKSERCEQHPLFCDIIPVFLYFFAVRYVLVIVFFRLDNYLIRIYKTKL